MMRLFILLLFLSTSTALTAQICGTHGEMEGPMIERLKANIETINTQTLEFRGNTIWIPIKWHLTARDNGTGRIKDQVILETMCALNEDFESMGVQFYIWEGFNLVNNTTIYEEHAAASGGVMSFIRDNDAIDIWVVKDATPFGDGLGTTLGYYSPSYDWIVIRNDELGANKATLTHEMGHFFSLAHPHRGWDSQPYDAATNGSPAPSVSPGGVPTECQNGSNCTVAGDMLCDTPPDYNFGFGFNGCNFPDNSVTDPCGDFVMPEERLWMGYFLDCPIDEYFFSPMQEALVLADIDNPSRNYLEHNVNVPGPLGTNSELSYPINGETTPAYNYVNLQWGAVENAHAYILEISKLASFPGGAITQSQIVYGENKVLTNLDASATYYWRIRPFNAFNGCASATSTQSFVTGNATATEDIEGLDYLLLSPNPSTVNGQLTLNIGLNQALDAELNIFSANGQKIKSMDQMIIPAGEQQITVSTAGLSAGIYMLQLTSNKGQTTRRLIIQ